SGKLIHLSELEKKRKEHLKKENAVEVGAKYTNYDKNKFVNEKKESITDENDFYINDRIYFNYLYYKTHNNFFSSDHKPVSAIIDLKVFFDKRDLECKPISSYNFRTDNEYRNLNKNNSNTSTSSSNNNNNNNSNNKNNNFLDYFFLNNYNLSKYTSYPISQFLNYSNTLNNKFKTEIVDNTFQEETIKDMDKTEE
ncbi:inositol-phosphate phosphatase, putative, partial [Hepatocystis sp. ex Piliocolobus tephrosceles]